MAETFDACVHQWAVDLNAMKDLVPPPWDSRLQIKSKIRDPISGTLMPSIPWYHSFWNEDRPGGPDFDAEDVRSPNRINTALADQEVERALLCGHSIRFLPSLPSPSYAAALATAYNEVVADDWLAAYDRFVAPIVVSMGLPTEAAAEIQARADHDGFVSVLVLGGGELPLGHDYYDPIYAAAAEADLPLTILTSGNPIMRQTAMGIPEHYATHDTNLVHNHMTNLVSMVFAGVFDRYPDLQTVWTGQGTSWILQTLWRSTRYYRNLKDTSPTLGQEPIDYLDSNCFVTTYPLGRLPTDTTTGLFDIVGIDNILYASGYPYWNSDTVDALPEMDNGDRQRILTDNAADVYGAG